MDKNRLEELRRKFDKCEGALNMALKLYTLAGATVTECQNEFEAIGKELSAALADEINTIKASHDQ